MITNPVGCPQSGAIVGTGVGLPENHGHNQGCLAVLAREWILWAAALQTLLTFRNRAGTGASAVSNRPDGWFSTRTAWPPRTG
jgi:hypothetical protein